MKKSKKYMKALALLMAFCILAALVPYSTAGAAANEGEKITISMIGKYDSADTAAIRSVDTELKEIRLRNHTTGKTYTLNYDNTSMMYDARGTVLSASLLEPGQIVDVTFLKSTRHITTLNVSSEAWTIESTREHDLVRGDGSARVKDETYRIDYRTLVMADGELALAEDVLSTDSVTVSGIGKDIYSVVVTSGHGYVSLSSDTVENQSLVGAWLELDNEVIYKISPNMLLSAPEGEYNLQILGNGASYSSEVSINRNEETVVDTSNVKVERPKEGLVTFEIIPEYAEVFVDGERALTGISQSYPYGYHNLKVMADGYITQTKYLKIGSPKSVISIELEEDTPSDAESSASASEGLSVQIISPPVDGASVYTSFEEDDEDSASTSTSKEKVKKTTTSRNKVIEDCRIYFDYPEDAEVYFDGAYVGIAPTSVAKISGTHEIILKREGYETKSYKISIDEEYSDETYTFPSLIRIDGTEEEGLPDWAASLSASEIAMILESLTGASSEDGTDEGSAELSLSASELASLLESIKEDSDEEDVSEWIKEILQNSEGAEGSIDPALILKMLEQSDDNENESTEGAGD